MRTIKILEGQTIEVVHSLEDKEFYIDKASGVTRIIMPHVSYKIIKGRLIEELAKDEMKADAKEMKFEKLGKAERKLLLEALDVSMVNMRCKYCDDKITYDTCSILSPLDGSSKPIIACNCPLCLSTYLEELEGAEE